MGRDSAQTPAAPLPLGRNLTPCCCVSNLPHCNPLDLPGHWRTSANPPTQLLLGARAGEPWVASLKFVTPGEQKEIFVWAWPSSLLAVPPSVRLKSGMLLLPLAVRSVCRGGGGCRPELLPPCSNAPQIGQDSRALPERLPPCQNTSAPRSQRKSGQHWSPRHHWVFSFF